MVVRRFTPNHKKNKRKYRKRIDNTENIVYNKYYKKHQINTIGADSMKQFKQQLFELLTIQAPSGKEEKVVRYVKPILEKLCDNTFIDSYGNLLAEKKVGDGKGATIVLSAHMDTVSYIQKGRKVIFDDKAQTFSSTKGVLGADDRAGIAIILAVLRNIDKAKFNGTIKVCFSREEEIGCVGADNIPVTFYQDASLAIVVDRRGSRDVVTGCGEMNGFCSVAVGEFFENVSALLDMEWKAVPGGVSDAVTFSGNGIHSVNLSAGYDYEHTSKEIVHVPSCRDTINLILQALSVVNSQVHKFGEVPESGSSYGSKYSYSSYSHSNMRTGYDSHDIYNAQEDYFESGDVTFYDAYDPWGAITGSTVGGYVSLYQKGTDKVPSNEVFMDEKAFRRMLDQYCLVSGYKVGGQLRDDAEQRRMDRELKDMIDETGDYEYGGKHYRDIGNGELAVVAF